MALGSMAYRQPLPYWRLMRGTCVLTETLLSGTDDAKTASIDADITLTRVDALCLND